MRDDTQNCDMNTEIRYKQGEKYIRMDVRGSNGSFFLHFKDDISDEKVGEVVDILDRHLDRFEFVGKIKRSSPSTTELPQSLVLDDAPEMWGKRNK